MESAPSASADSEELHNFINQLQVELEHANQERTQAAQCGIQLLEENQNLKRQVEEKDISLEQIKLELEQVQKAHHEYQQSHRLGSMQGEQESLLDESTAREQSYKETIEKLEQELRVTKQQSERLQQDSNRLQQNVQELQLVLESRELDIQRARKELRELKAVESQLMVDYSELEEENVALQTQTSQLRQNQIDFEALKMEIDQIKDQNLDLKSQLEDLQKLKSIVDSSLNDALTALQQEREQRLAMKRDFEQRLASSQADSFDRWGSLVSSMTGPSKQSGGDGCDGGSGGGATAQENGSNVGDLLSELRSTEVVRLEQSLQTLRQERDTFQNSFDEVKRKSEDYQLKMAKLERDCDGLKAKLETVVDVAYAAVKCCTVAPGDDEEKAKSSKATTVDDMDSLSHRLSAIAVSPTESSEKLASALSNLMAAERRCSDMERQLKLASSGMTTAQSGLVRMREELSMVTEELEQLYHHACQVVGKTPDRLLLAAATQPLLDSKDQPIQQQQQHTPPSQQHRRCSLDGASENSSELSCERLVDLVHNQVRHLSSAFQDLTNRVEQRDTSAVAIVGSDGNEENNNDTKRAIKSSSDGSSGLITDEEVQRELAKAKAMLNTKREQVATLRSLLKSNKQTAEMALSRLRQKYDYEKQVVTETMNKLRTELKTLKEDAATFASLRAMFAQRCDDYVTQLSEQQRQLSAAEEEKKTLNSLLRMAIQQVNKFMFTIESEKKTHDLFIYLFID